MSRPVILVFLLTFSFVSCKPEHPDLKTAHALYMEAAALKQTILTSKVEVLNQAKMIDSRIRNEDKESVFAISEAYVHLEDVDKGLKKLGSELAVPGHETNGVAAIDAKMDPSQILMIQKNHKDSLQLIKNDLDAAVTLINSLKTKVK